MGFFGRDDKQRDQLVKTYSDRSDAELLDMYQQREGLTEAAQDALQQVMRDRRLQPSETAIGDVADAANAEPVKQDELLYMFDDAFDAREAMRHLTEAEVEHRLVDWHTVDPELRNVRPTLQLGLLVPKEEQARAIDILREKLDLFPIIDDNATQLNPVGELVLLAMFDLPEALQAAQTLGEAGISYLWRDGRDETRELPDGETIAIEVRTPMLERATKLVEERLASSEPTPE